MYKRQDYRRLGWLLIHWGSCGKCLWLIVKLHPRLMVDHTVQLTDMLEGKFLAFANKLVVRDWMKSSRMKPGGHYSMNITDVEHYFWHIMGVSERPPSTCQVHDDCPYKQHIQWNFCADRQAVVAQELEENFGSDASNLWEFFQGISRKIIEVDTPIILSTWLACAVGLNAYSRLLRTRLCWSWCITSATNAECPDDIVSLHSPLVETGAIMECCIMSEEGQWLQNTLAGRSWTQGTEHAEDKS